MRNQCEDCVTMASLVKILLFFSGLYAAYGLPLVLDSPQDVQTGRQLQQGSATIKPCRWNENYGSCDFNYDYVAGIKPTTPGAETSRQWFINAKSCDSPAYQASQALCQGDNTHFCRWIGGTGKVKCVAVLQEFYNFWNACPGSVAKDYFLCKNKFTQRTCINNRACRWIAPAAGTPVCKAARLTATLNAWITSTSLPVFRGAWGTCPGSNTAFNQTLCSKQRSRALCTGSKFCTYAVFSSGPVCYINAAYSPLFLYQNDASFKFLLKRCNVGNKAACEGLVQAASLDG